MKPAPGTWGSLGALPVGLLLFGAGGLIGLILGIVCIFSIGIWASNRFDAAQGGHDNSMIVIDEVAGQWIALLPVLFFWGTSPVMILLSFAAFRFFDILKPWPVSFFDKNLKGGLGVMLDDVAAGLYAALIITGVHYAGFG